jgi:hypothetical protein
MLNFPFDFTIFLHEVLNLISTPALFKNLPNALITSEDLSLCGKTLPPLSVFWGQPHFSSRLIVSCGEKAFKALKRNLGFVTTLLKNSVTPQLFVILHLPLPVIYSFLPSFSLRSIKKTEAPLAAAAPAAIMPAGPPPITAIFTA